MSAQTEQQVIKRPRFFARDSPDAFERERPGLLTQLADPITTGG
jgi:hypothetical protein